MGVLKKIVLTLFIVLFSSNGYAVELLHNRAGAPIKKDVSISWIKFIAADFLSQCNDSKLFVSGSSIYDFAGTAMNYAMLNQLVYTPEQLIAQIDLIRSAIATDHVTVRDASLAIIEAMGILSQRGTVGVIALFPGIEEYIQDYTVLDNCTKQLLDAFLVKQRGVAQTWVPSP